MNEFLCVCVWGGKLTNKICELSKRSQPHPHVVYYRNDGGIIVHDHGDIDDEFWSNWK